MTAPPRPRLALVAATLLLAACVGDDEPECDPSVPIGLSCPAEVDLGCTGAEGLAADYVVTASSCQEPDPALVCSPPAGTVVTPGSVAVHCEAALSTGERASCDFAVVAHAPGEFTLDCPAAVTAACAGPRTPVALAAATATPLCGAPTGPVTSDAPPDGFPPGDSTVTFSAPGEAGFTGRCTSEVHVTDDAAPVLACPASVTAMRTAPGTPATVPALSASDACYGALEAVPSPALLDASGPVTYAAEDGAGNRAECGTSAVVVEAPPVTELRVVSARPEVAATRVTLAWDTPPPLETAATGYRIERATSATGPWTELGAVGPDAHTFTDPALADLSAWYRVVTLVDLLAGGESEAVRAFAVRTASYDIGGVPVPTVPFATSLYGVVRYPADPAAGPYPLVLLLHGNHGNCRPSPFTSDDECAYTTTAQCPWSGYTTTPNAEGLAYLAETLAAHGFVAVSVSANALNCRDDYILERTELLLEHLRRWRAWATAGGAPFGSTFVGLVDTGRVGLAGHSRGGEAVAHAPAQLSLTPITGVTIASVFSIAPTDYHDPAPAGVPYAVLLPACDGDVSDLSGMHIYDRGLDAAGAAARSQVFVIGANHNYFSTEWHYDDNGTWADVCALSDEIGGVAQQGLLEGTLSAWFDGTILGAGLEGFLTADAATPEGIVAWAGSDLDLRWSHAAAARLLVDDLAGAGAPYVNRLGGANTFTEFATASGCFETGCGSDFAHRRSAVLLSWTSGVPRAAWDLGALDAGAATAFSFRVTSRSSTYNTGVTAQDFLVRIADASGTEAAFLLSDLTVVPHLYPSYDVRNVLQTVRLPLDRVSELAPALDLADLARFELEMTVAGHTRGSVVVTDLELAD